MHGSFAVIVYVSRRWLENQLFEQMRNPQQLVGFRSIDLDARTRAIFYDQGNVGLELAQLKAYCRVESRCHQNYTLWFGGKLGSTSGVYRGPHIIFEHVFQEARQAC